MNRITFSFAVHRFPAKKLAFTWHFLAASDRPGNSAGGRKKVVKRHAANVRSGRELATVRKFLNTFSSVICSLPFLALSLGKASS
jgi:hypothetical protein